MVRSERCIAAYCASASPNLNIYLGLSKYFIRSPHKHIRMDPRRDCEVSDGMLVLEVKVKILCCRDCAMGIGMLHTADIRRRMHIAVCVRSPFTCAHNSKLWAHDGPAA